MNLHATWDGEEIDLRQTPTHITNMICINSEGLISCLTGNDAIRGLYAYLEWVTHATMKPSYANEDDLEEDLLERKKQIDYIMCYINKAKRTKKKLEVYTL
jgi:hypothetical protein